MNDLAIAQLLEQEILVGNGLTASCGCPKFVLCPFPTTPWYYATLCKHDNDSAPRALTPLIERAYWWYDLNRRRMISAIDFEKKYKEMMVGHAPPSAFSARDLDQFFQVRMGKNLFAIGRGGQVRRMYPKPGDWL